MSVRRVKACTVANPTTILTTLNDHISAKQPIYIADKTHNWTLVNIPLHAVPPHTVSSDVGERVDSISVCDAASCFAFGLGCKD